MKQLCMQKDLTIPGPCYDQPKETVQLPLGPFYKQHLRKESQKCGNNLKASLQQVVHKKYDQLSPKM